MFYVKFMRLKNVLNYKGGQSREPLCYLFRNAIMESFISLESIVILFIAFGKRMHFSKINWNFQLSHSNSRLKHVSLIQQLKPITINTMRNHWRINKIYYYYYSHAQYRRCIRSVSKRLGLIPKSREFKSFKICCFFSLE